MATQQEKISAIQDILNSQYSSTRWKTFLSELFTSSNFFSNPTPLLGINATVASQALQIGSINIIQSGISRNIAVYEVTLADNVVLERNRVGLRNLLKTHWKQQDAAFIVYHHPQEKSWRFSYVSELKTFNEAGEYVDNKTEPKRYTYVLGENESCRTAAIQFCKLQDKASNATLDDIKEAFSVEKMSKEFFDTYKDHYQDFVQYLTGKRLEKVSGKWEEVVKHAPNTQLITIFNNNEKDVRDFCKKLLGRIVFLYFIQKKGWLGVPLHDKWGNGKPDFISRLLANCRNPSIFYSEYLSKLFFETLNQQRPDDLAEIIPGEKTRVPYLNGGLFEEDDPNQRGLIFEAELFKDLFAFFDQYNFTIYEDDPNDHTVAVDPEMLGHIFENLLEDNKDKGAFYTPKEIVHYMCQESLIEYLTTWFEGKNYQVQQDTFISFDNAQQASFLSANEGRTGQGVLEVVQPAQSNSKVINRSLIEKLLKKQLSDENKQAVIEHAAEFNEALDKVKICDPAIGSGAFPMGLLLEIFTAKQTIHTFTHGDLTTFEPAKVKLNIIQNSIYGVDIERGAVDIARLRFWLSLVVDEPEPQPLPNLDYKIVVGNSLISKLGDDVIEIDWDVKKQVTFDMFGADETDKIKQTLTELNQLQKAFFNPQSDKKALAPKIRNLKIDLLIQQLSLMIATRGLKVVPRKMATQSQKDFVAQTELYLQTQGWLAQICQLQALKVQPDKTLDFFDWQLNFAEILNKEVGENENVGFDIVIGNPPYVKEYTNKDAFTSIPYYQGKMDIWYAFTCVGLDLLKKNGHLSFIATNNWVTNAGASIMRNKILSESKIVKLVDFGSYMIFENAAIQTMIMFFQKATLPKYALDLKRIVSQDASFDDVKDVLTQISSDRNEFLTPSIIVKDVLNKTITFSNNNNNEILLKIQHKGTLFLTESEVANGIHPHYDYVNKNSQKILGGEFHVGQGIFVLSNLEKNAINLNNEEKNIIKPYFTTAQIQKWYATPQNVEWIIYTDSKFKYIKNIEPYPNIKKHLDQFQSVITSDNKPYGLHRARDERFFKGEKIITLRKCVGEPKFTYTNFDCYVSATFYVIKTERLSQRYLVGLLNSKLIAFWLRNKGKMQGNNYQLDKEPLLMIPIYLPSKEQEIVVENLVDKIIIAKSVNKNTTHLECEIDSLVYRFYNLTFIEIKVIDPDFAISESEYNAIVI